MRYAIYYMRLSIPYFLTIFTLGLLKQNSVNWKSRTTVVFFSLFWVLDIIPIVLSLGKITSVWHSKACNLFYERNLVDLAARNDKKWSTKFIETVLEILFFPKPF